MRIGARLWLPVLAGLAVAGVLAGEAAPVPIPVPDETTLRYYREGNLLWILVQAWNLLLPITFLAWGLARGLEDRLATRIGSPRLRLVAFVAIYTAGCWLVSRPLAWCVGFVRPHAYGLSNQDPARWLELSMKSLGVELAVLAVAALVIHGLLAWSPGRWWAWAALAFLPLEILAMLVWPIFIDPLFHTFRPLRDPALETRILTLADRAGIGGDRVFEVDKSRDTKQVNAYVTGVMGSHRIVLWDTLLTRLPAEQVEFVMGHEIGHYALGHIGQGILAGFLGVLVGLGLVDLGARRLLAGPGVRWGVSRLETPAAWPLLLVVYQLVFLAGLPLANGVSRSLEREADLFALELTRDNRSGALGFLALQQQNLSHPNPGPVFRIFRSSHPSLAERIDTCNRYRPWVTGDPLRFPSIRPSAAASGAGATGSGAGRGQSEGAEHHP